MVEHDATPSPTYFRPCTARLSPLCEGGQTFPLAGDPESPMNRQIADIFGRPMACDSCAGLLLMKCAEASR